MKRWIMVPVLLLFFSQVFPVSNDEIRDIMEKKTATVGDALLLVSAMDNADIGKDDVKVKGNNRLSALNQKADLTAGDLGVILIELKKAKGGLFYMVTGFGKYATESLIYNDIYPEHFSWNRSVSGKELIEFVSVIKDARSDR